MSHSSITPRPATRIISRPRLPARSAITARRTTNTTSTTFSRPSKAGNLPSVSYVKAARYQDAHPGNSDPLLEQVFVVNVINALQRSEEWAQTAVFIQYDDSDGWYDHVTGPIVNASATNIAGQ